VLHVAGAGLLGLLVGSFLNVVIHRLPRMLERDWRRQCADLQGTAPAPADEAPYNLVRPGSACPHCGTAIRPWQNIPVVSYLLLGGRCAQCKARIPLRYPVVEAGTALASALVAWQLGPTPEAAAAIGVTWCLIALAGIDLDHHLLPDSLTLPLLWAGLLFHVLRGPDTGDGVFASLTDGVIGAVAGYLSLWTIYHGFRITTGKEGMGYGDFKLFAALGAWLGWQRLPLVILLSAVAGTVVSVSLIALRRHSRETPIPFGPYLAAAGFVAILWGRDLVAAYWRAGTP
jgi:leader peptidase (prepilin peptidase)/N-methyltransferase